MTVCNFTQYIPGNQCLGDSLLTINQNFSALDDGLCSVPVINSDSGLKLKLDVSEQGKTHLNISTKNSYTFTKEFSFLANATNSTIGLRDGTHLDVITFPAVTGLADPKPFGIFEVAAHSNKSPELTLYWTASGENQTTLFSLNSSASVVNRGNLWPNDSVTALYRFQNTLYVGGNFTTIGGVTTRKFAVINLLNNTLQANPFAAEGDLGAEGSVNAIEIFDSNFLIVGGSFKSATKGRGLCIINTVTGIVYPFYVNGDVHTLILKNSLDGVDLFVGGNFDYLNYGAASNFQPKVFTKGLARISMSRIQAGFPNASIRDEFCNYIENLFDGTATVHALAVRGDSLFVGGEFKTKNGSRYNAKNLLSFQGSGSLPPVVYQAITNGPVYDLLVVEQSLMYVGGDFTTYHTPQEYTSNPRNNTNASYSNLLAINVSSEINPTAITAWKPQFNGPVIKLAADNLNLFCYGQFTTVNDQARAYLAAITRNPSLPLRVLLWMPNLQTAPDVNNNALLTYPSTPDSVIVGGNFTRINSNIRYYFARIQIAESNYFSAVNWDFGGQIISNGMSSLLDFTNTPTVRLSAIPEPYGNITTTRFPIIEEGFKGLQQGQLCRFFIRRPGTTAAIGSLPATSDGFTKSVHIVGWALNFDK